MVNNSFWFLFISLAISSIALLTYGFLYYKSERKRLSVLRQKVEQAENELKIDLQDISQDELYKTRNGRELLITELEYAINNILVFIINDPKVRSRTNSNFAEKIRQLLLMARNAKSFDEARLLLKAAEDLLVNSLVDIDGDKIIYGTDTLNVYDISSEIEKNKNNRVSVNRKS